ncbi:DUF362 domain-containing protein [Candidatus Woesearchaeota archaeon]|nr:DUF362 domain-containing protein [Candidatus Woesearchaeota archaeon]
MADVCFSEDIDKILDKVDYAMLGKRVGIKVHFGEKGCNTHINPQLVRNVFDRLTAEGKDVHLVECNVLYKGSRTDRKSHVETAREHGFDMPIDILDGERGKDEVVVDGCKLGKGLEKYDSLVVLTHFKGHMFAGFGGSLKNLGMGLGSRAGKLDMHASVRPTISASKCIACGTCIRNCDVKAISMVDGKAKIDPAVCVGCAMCIAVCPTGAASIPWSSHTPYQLQEKIAKYAKAALKLVPNSIFINVLQNITKECDCMGISQEPMMDDVGVLYSKDIVAIDKASLDLADRSSDGAFSRINKIDKMRQIQSAEKLGMGSSSYELVNL